MTSAKAKQIQFYTHKINVRTLEQVKKNYII